MNREKMGSCIQLPSQERVLGYLGCFRTDPPNVLLLEGSDLEEREKCAFYWSALLNCPNASPAPCLQCSVCKLVFASTFRDQYFFSGREGSIKIEDVRDIRNIMGQKPEFEGFRVFIISQAQELTSSAANALLKSMEEPMPGNVFVLLAPERNKLLPTLVSRSWILTLSWSDSGCAEDEAIQNWLHCLLQFWETGRGLFDQTAKKNSIDVHLVRQIIAACQKSLLQLMIGEPDNQVCKYWSRSLGNNYLGSLDNLFKKCLQALEQQVNPCLVLDWMAVQIYQWCNCEKK